MFEVFENGDIQQMQGSIRLTSSTTTTEVTMADNGATFQLHVGDRIWLNLDSGYDWSVSFGDPDVVGGADTNLCMGCLRVFLL